MAITINHITYDLEKQKDYQTLQQLVKQSSDEVVNEIYRQIQLEQQLLSEAPNEVMATPNQKIQPSNVELLDKISDLKRSIEKRLNIGKRNQLDPNAKVIRKLDFDRLTVTEVAEQLPNTQYHNKTSDHLHLSKPTFDKYKQTIECLPTNHQIVQLSLHGIRLGPKFCTVLDNNLLNHPLNTLMLNVCIAPKHRLAQSLSQLIPSMPCLHQLKIAGSQYHKDNTHFLCAAIQASSITETNLIDQNQCQIAFSDKQRQQMKERIENNQANFVTVIKMITEKKPAKEIKEFIDTHHVILTQAGGKWSKNYYGHTALQYAILSAEPELVELVLSYIPAKQIPQHLNRLIRYDYNSPLIKTFQLTNYLNSNQNKIIQLLERHPGIIKTKQFQQQNFRQKKISHSTKKSRPNHDYSEKINAAIAGTTHAKQTDKTLSGQQALILEHLRRASAEITEHASRRCDLAFYTFIAYYQKNTPVEINDTQITFGKGEKSIVSTEACHSALLSNFLDQTMAIEKQHATRSGAVKTVKYSLLDNTHLSKSLNSTIELPIVVNNCDSVLEEKIDAPSFYRQRYLQLINQVSFGKITPVEAMAQFFVMLEDFFEYEASWVNEGNFLVGITPPAARQLVIDHQRKGSFAGKWNYELSQNKETEADKKGALLSDEYIFSLLHLRASEINAFYRCDQKAQQLLLIKACMKIQADIYGQNSIIKINTIDELWSFLKRDNLTPQPQLARLSDNMKIDQSDLDEHLFGAIISSRNTDLLHQLLACAAANNITFDYKSDPTPLFIASELACTDSLSLLIKHGYEINVGLWEHDEITSEYTTTPLHLAARAGHLGVVNDLIGWGAIVNCFDDDYYSPLFYACELACVSMVLMLLQAGADPLLQRSGDDINAITLMLKYMMDSEEISKLAKIINNSNIETLSLKQIFRISNPNLQIVCILLTKAKRPDILAEFFKEKAQTEFEKGKYQSAIDFFQALLKTDPHDGSTYQSLAECYQQLAKQRLMNHKPETGPTLAAKNLTALLKTDTPDEHHKVENHYKC